MAFSNFKSIAQVIQKYPLAIKQERFIPELSVELPELFMENLNFIISRSAIQESEMFWRESLIFPFLQEAWKKHPRLKLWSGMAIKFDDELYGETDYLVSEWMEGKVISELVSTPLLSVMEAKKEDFEMGWGQCLAELIACQKINDTVDLVLYGIVSTGEIWQFGKLEKDIFTRERRSFSINYPHQVIGALSYVFGQCEKQL